MSDVGVVLKGEGMFFTLYLNHLFDKCKETKGIAE